MVSVHGCIFLLLTQWSCGLRSLESTMHALACNSPPLACCSLSLRNDFENWKKLVIRCVYTGSHWNSKICFEVKPRRLQYILLDMRFTILILLSRLLIVTYYSKQVQSFLKSAGMWRDFILQLLYSGWYGLTPICRFVFNVKNTLGC